LDGGLQLGNARFEGADVLSNGQECLLPQLWWERRFTQKKGLTLFGMLDDYLADYEQRGLRDVQITRYRIGTLQKFFRGSA
jgi:hypothetical protein